MRPHPHQAVTIITAEMSFELQPEESLLEGLERTGHEVEYQCRGGYCGACRIKLLSGTVLYEEAPLAFIGEDEVLPCCCTPLETIKIDVQRKLSPQDEQNDLFSINKLSE